MSCQPTPVTLTNPGAGLVWLFVKDMPGSGDCEARLDVWGQPTLFASSASYIVAGLFVFWLWRRREAGPLIAIYGVGLVLAGLGSMDYHGPVIGPEPLLHDGGLAVALMAAAALDLQQLGVRRLVRTPGLLALTAIGLVVIAVVPAISPLLAGVAAVGLITAEVLIYRRGVRQPTAALWSALTALLIGAVVYALSRTGGPLCQPDSWLQGHAVWHVLTAMALALWAVTATEGEK